MDGRRRGGVLTASTETAGQPRSRAPRVIGWGLSIVAALFLAFDAAIHLANPPFVMAAMEDTGWPAHLAPLVGALEVVCLVLWLVPRTAVLGAVLQTDYLGGAVATNLRIEAPLFSTVLFPVYVALFVWGGLWLRRSEVRGVLPLVARRD